MKIEEYVSTMPCIVCDKSLKSALPDISRNQVNQPDNGTCFWTSGHYGSTVFDPMSADIRAEINICDECWKRKIQSILFLDKGIRISHEDGRL